MYRTACKLHFCDCKPTPVCCRHVLLPRVGVTLLLIQPFSHYLYVHVPNISAGADAACSRRVSCTHHFDKFAMYHIIPCVSDHVCWRCENNGALDMCACCSSKNDRAQRQPVSYVHTTCKSPLAYPPRKRRCRRYPMFRGDAQGRTLVSAVCTWVQ